MAEETTQPAKRTRRKKLWLIIGVVVLVVAAAGAGVALRWWQNKNGDNGGASTPTPTLTESAGELQNLRSEGSEEEFNEQADEILNDPATDDKTRYQVLLQKGHAASDKEDYDKAIEIYKQAEQVDGTLEAAELIAETYRLSGDNDNAIEYYRKALGLVSDSNARASGLRDLYRGIIEELEGQQ